MEDDPLRADVVRVSELRAGRSTSPQSRLDLDGSLPGSVGSRHEKGPPEKPALLSNSRWLAYATAGAATALGTIPSAEAEIHYSGVVDVIVDPRPGTDVATTTLPLSNGVSIKLHVFSVGFYHYNYASFKVLGADLQHGFRRTKVGLGGDAVRRLPPGSQVSQGPFQQSKAHSYGNIVSAYGGDWKDGGQGYIGFRLNSGAGTQYGWVRIKIAEWAYSKLIVREYAWSDPGESIQTGQKKSNSNDSVAVPDQGSLGLLALGGAGLMAWRKRRSMVAQ